MVRKKSKTKSCDPLPSTLSLSFSGPMFFDFGSSPGLVDVYVPYCPFHEVGFFFYTGSYSESDIYECAAKKTDPSKLMRNYSIASGGIPLLTAQPSAIVPVGSAKKPITTRPGTSSAPRSGDGQIMDNYIRILSIDGMGTRAVRNGLPQTICKRLLKLTVPMPRYLSSLYTDQVMVIPGAPTPSPMIQTHCTSVRFYYDWDACYPVTLTSPLKPLDLTPPVYCEFPRVTDIEIRYEGISLEDQNDPHSDARSCFASLATMAGTDWFLDYNDGRTSPTNSFVFKKARQDQSGNDPLPRDPCCSLPDECGGGGTLHLRTGADCHAPIITTGLALSEL